MQFAVIEKLALEQAAEGFKTDAVGLPHACRNRHVVKHLSQQDATHNDSHQKQYHRDQILVASSADGLVDEALAEPYHDQATLNVERQMLNNKL